MTVVREKVEKEFMTAIKKRYYVNQVRDYLHVFKDIEGTILSWHKPGGLKEPYVYSTSIEEDPFFREESKEAAAVA